MRRPGLDTTPRSRTVADYATDLAGGGAEQIPEMQIIRQSSKPASLLAAKPAIPKPAIVAASEQVKLSVLIPVELKEHLGMIKLRLRRRGVKISEAKIVELLINGASEESILALVTGK